ncbi:MAG: ABC transporter substrate-binding protein [Candidatus Hodarchaeota archaeon]
MTPKWSSKFRPNGGYVDELQFLIYPRSEYPLAMVALQNGDIDAFDEQPQQSYLGPSIRDQNVEYTFTPSLSYRALILNCAMFPTNITAFRRAMAFGFDKNRANVECIGGVGQPQDSHIPVTAIEWEIESELNDHFYGVDYVSGNASLENAGFRDLDGDGWREYDVNDNDEWDPGIDFEDDTYANGDPLELFATAGYDPAIQACIIMVDGLAEMGIRAETVEFDWSTLGFPWQPQVACWTEEITITNPSRLLYDNFRAGAKYNRDPYNYYHFSNSTIDAVLDHMIASTTINDTKRYAREAALLLAFEQPTIVVYINVIINAYRTDNFEGFFEFKGLGTSSGENPYVATKVHLKESKGGPYGGTFYYCLSGNINTLNPYLQQTQYEATVSQYIYEKLWNIDPTTWDPIPGLAYDWDIVQTTASGDIRQGQKFTFYLYENETWHDGEPFTAADVNHSIYMWRDSPYHTPEMWDIYKIELPEGSAGHIIEFYVNETGYFEWADTTGFYITPKHVWQEVENVTAYSPVFNEVIGTGPYMLANYVPEESITLERHEDWRWDIRDVNHHLPNCFSSTSQQRIITTNGQMTTLSSHTPAYLDLSLDLLSTLQIVELGTVVLFGIILIIIIRRYQWK